MGLSERTNNYKMIRNYACINHDSYLTHMVSEINLSHMHKCKYFFSCRKLRVVWTDY